MKYKLKIYYHNQTAYETGVDHPTLEQALKQARYKLSLGSVYALTLVNMETGEVVINFHYEKEAE